MMFRIVMQPPKSHSGIACELEHAINQNHRQLIVWQLWRAVDTTRHCGESAVLAHGCAGKMPPGITR
jgi:hypothetical protein